MVLVKEIRNPLMGMDQLNHEPSDGVGERRQL